MRFPAVCLVVLGLIAAGARAHAGDDGVAAADGAAIRGVIERQIAAFAKDDAATAFGFASPAIQQQFGSPETFMRMVQEGYRPVYRPRSVSFGEARRLGESVVQQVDVIGPDGVGAHAFYTMEHERDGSWRIGGCTLTRSSDKEI
jgi:hypothetical protein